MVRGTAWRGVLGLAVALSALSALADVSVAAEPGGTPYTWGGNGFGQLGVGGTTPRLLAGPVTGLSDVVDLHGGREHVVALRGDGSVWTWGSNQQGQLGLGTTANNATPTPVPSLAGVTAVETGHNHSLALRADGSVWTWGLNADGQLGDATTSTRRSPVRVAGLDDAVAIAAGRNMSYAIRAGGTVVAWGRNDEGQLGDGTLVRRLTPVRTGALTGIVEIAGGRDHGLAVDAQGAVWTWGSNNYGQLGIGSLTDRSAPVQVTTGVRGVIAGAHHSYALREDGRMLSWGRNYRANLGDGTTTQRTTPVSVLGVTGVVSIGSGRDHGLAVLADGTARAWGANAQGQLGDGTTVNRSLSVPVSGIQGAVKAGGGGAEFSVLVVGDGPPANLPPTARVAVECSGLVCDFDGSGSSDPEGSPLGFSWSFGDGSHGEGVDATHTYAADGSYQVRLTVTDDGGADDAAIATVQLGEQPAPTTLFRASAATDANTVQPVVPVPPGVEAGDRLLLFVTLNRAGSTSTPPGWSLAGVVTDGADLRSWVFTRAASAGLGGSTVGLTLDATSKTSLVLLAYQGAGDVHALASASEPGSSAAHSAPASIAPAGARVVRYWADKSSTPHAWTLPAGVSERAGTTGSSGGLLTTVAGDTADVTAGPVPSATAVAGVASSKAVAWTVVLPPS